jgi:hypothetical protein
VVFVANALFRPGLILYRVDRVSRVLPHLDVETSSVHEVLTSRIILQFVHIPIPVNKELEAQWELSDLSALTCKPPPSLLFLIEDTNASSSISTTSRILDFVCVSSLHNGGMGLE